MDLQKEIEKELISCANTVNYFTLNSKVKRALVLDVYDGDTITVVLKHFNEINKWKIRLLGINSPEIRPRKNIENREDIIEAAKASRHYLESLILNKLIYIHCGEFDNFGRILAYLYLDKSEIGNIDKSINMIMINTGHARVY